MPRNARGAAAPLRGHGPRAAPEVLPRANDASLKDRQAYTDIAALRIDVHSASIEWPRPGPPRLRRPHHRVRQSQRDLQAAQRPRRRQVQITHDELRSTLFARNHRSATSRRPGGRRAAPWRLPATPRAAEVLLVLWKIAEAEEINVASTTSSPNRTRPRIRYTATRTLITRFGAEPVEHDPSLVTADPLIKKLVNDRWPRTPSKTRSRVLRARSSTSPTRRPRASVAPSRRPRLDLDRRRQSARRSPDARPDRHRYPRARRERAYDVCSRCCASGSSS